MLELQGSTGEKCKRKISFRIGGGM